MKKSIKISALLFFLISFLFLEAAPKPTAKTITVAYHNGCFIGCGTVDVNRQLTTVTLGDGTTQEYIYRRVSCTGFGFKACPSVSGAIINNDDGGNWFDMPSGEMFDYAIEQMENEVNSGTYRKTYRNIETGQTLVFEVVWSYTEVSEGEWEQSIEVAIIQ